MTGILRIGFLEGFKGSDTVLMAGDEHAMRALADVLLDLGSERTDVVHFEALPFVQVFRSVSLAARRVPTSLGIRFTEKAAHWHQPFAPSPQLLPSFEWSLTGEDWADVRERVLALHGGHQYPCDYLGTVDDVAVIISTNEYGDGWWQRHGSLSA